MNRLASSLASKVRYRLSEFLSVDSSEDLSFICFELLTLFITCFCFFSPTSMAGWLRTLSGRLKTVSGWWDCPVFFYIFSLLFIFNLSQELLFGSWLIYLWKIVVRILYQVGSRLSWGRNYVSGSEEIPYNGKLMNWPIVSHSSCKSLTFFFFVLLYINWCCVLFLICCNFERKFYLKTFKGVFEIKVHVLGVLVRQVIM